MNTVAFVLVLIAAILFAVEFLRSNWQSFIALGMCLLSVGLICEFAATSHDITF